MVEGEPGGLPDFGPYRVRDLLGQGGMGVVHRAYDTVNDRVVALKRLSVADRDYRARFQRESRIVAGLRHPNVIPVNAFGEIDGQLYLDMMLVEGVDLRRAIGSGAVDQDRAIKILAQVADALDAAHASGLVHRDVKPSNILIDPDGHAYLADFGIARETSSEATVLTASGDLIGSWDYMAPERLSGGPVDGRADQYSLACVLFECLTGRLPYPVGDTAAKVAAHLLQPPPSPSVFIPTITPALDAVVLRGMAKSPTRRFESSTSLVTAAESAAYSGITVRAAAHTAPGPSSGRDQGRLVRAIVRSTTVRTRPTLVVPLGKPPTCPYPGLSGFDQEDVDLFHGRDHVVTDLLVRLAEQLDGGEPVVLVGASGAGKSSVLHAGLLPALALGDGPGQGDWPQIVVAPGNQPIATLATALAAHGDLVAAEWDRVIREKPAEFGSVCARALGVGDGVRPVIVVDQFEELFTHGVPEAERLAFATALANARPALVVLAVRADLVDRCIDLAPLLPALNAPVLLGAMDATELRQAIVSPARDSGIDIEPGLPERLIADLGVRGEIGYDPGALPRLAHALRESWNYRDGDVLTLAAYRRAGGIDGAVSRTAEEIHDRLPESDRRTLRTILLRLVTVSDDGAVSRRRVDPREISGSGEQQGIVDELIAARLVTVDGTGARLSHEALVTAWPRLRDWIDEDRAGLVQHRRFTDSVRVWEESGRQPDDLYRGVRLAALTSWLTSAADRVRLQPVEREFLDRSNEAEHAGQVAARRRTNRLRGLVVALSLLLVVAGVAGVVAYQFGQTARAERDRADVGKQQNLSRQLAAESALAKGIDGRRAALAALGAWQASQTVEGRSAVLQVGSDSFRGRLAGHTAAVTGVAVTGDGKTAVTGGRDGSLRVWDVATRKELAVLADGDGWYRTVAIRSDGLVAAAADITGKKVELWSVPDRELIATVPVAAIDFAFAPDGRTIALNIGSAITVVDTTTFAEVGRFPIGVTIAMAFSPDASLIATAAGKDVLVHRVADGALVATLTGHTDEVLALAFDPVHATLATAGNDSTVRWWDTGSWTTTKTLTADGPVNTLAYNAKSTVLLSGGVATSFAVWNPVTGTQMVRYATGSTTVVGLAVAADGHTLVAGDTAGQVRTWSHARNVLGGRENAITGTAFQHGGDLLAMGDGGGAVRLWNAATGDFVRSLAGHADSVMDVEFSPDGRELVSSAKDGTLIVWNVETGAEVRRYVRPGTELKEVAFSPDGALLAVAGSSPVESTEDHDEALVLKVSDLTVAHRRPTREEARNERPDNTVTNYPTGVAFSPDGRTVALPLSGGKVALWNLVDPGAAFTILDGHDGIALGAAFSPDGATLATVGTDRLVRLWRMGDGQQTGELTGSDSPPRAVAFSPDGRAIATASQDTVLRLWDVVTGQPLARLDRHEDDLNEVVFDPDGDRIASSSADGTVRLWNLVPDEAVRVVCGVLDRDTLADEWRALGPDRGDPPNCPS
ncbi:protein kinase [Umezawaea endophytica]|uniref:non-specific serine/threonine protein kinase n=1 Tax=Umezawaea endophytica TaxID=1654476 RepID=A0A9X2VKG3_9PSEU|nr:serine/threonine-protein kinase [Umezawaea endophytica]MCS7478182.1 protein kinase [Umezawaea endophytica]